MAGLPSGTGPCGRTTSSGPRIRKSIGTNFIGSAPRAGLSALPPGSGRPVGLEELNGKERASTLARVRKPH